MKGICGAVHPDHSQVQCHKRGDDHTEDHMDLVERLPDGVYRSVDPSPSAKKCGYLREVWRWERWR